MAKKSTECNPYVSKIKPDVTKACYITTKVPWVSTHPRVTYNMAPLVMCASHTIADGEIIFFPGEVGEIIVFPWVFLRKSH
jgi:hypothetical protein